MSDNEGMEIMPNVLSAFRRRKLVIDNLLEDRHTDELLWVRTMEEGSHVLTLTEAQARDLLATLTAHVTAWDKGAQA
jgi:hypothetical protein